MALAGEEGLTGGRCRRGGGAAKGGVAVVVLEGWEEAIGLSNFKGWEESAESLDGYPTAQKFVRFFIRKSCARCVDKPERPNQQYPILRNGAFTVQCTSTEQVNYQKAISPFQKRKRKRRPSLLGRTRRDPPSLPLVESDSDSIENRRVVRGIHGDP